MNNRILLISIPKAGTYYVSEVLKNLGWSQSYLHLNLESYEDYSDADLAHALKDPGAYRVREKLSKVLDRLPDRGFAVGHLPASDTQLIKGGVKRSLLGQQFRLLFLVRDLRRCIISHMNFDVFMRNQFPALKMMTGCEMLIEYLRQREDFLYRSYQGLVPWLWEPGVSTLRYESLLDGTLCSLADAGNEELKNAIDLASRASTLTRSTHDSSPDRYWSEEAGKIYRRRIRALNRLLGYDPDVSPGAAIKNPLRNVAARSRFRLTEWISLQNGETKLEQGNA